MSSRGSELASTLQQLHFQLCIPPKGWKIQSGQLNEFLSKNNSEAIIFECTDNSYYGGTRRVAFQRDIKADPKTGSRPMVMYFIHWGPIKALERLSGKGDGLDFGSLSTHFSKAKPNYLIPYSFNGSPTHAGNEGSKWQIRFLDKEDPDEKDVRSVGVNIGQMKPYIVKAFFKTLVDFGILNQETAQYFMSMSEANTISESEQKRMDEMRVALQQNNFDMAFATAQKLYKRNSDKGNAFFVAGMALLNKEDDFFTSDHSRKEMVLRSPKEAYRFFAAVPKGSPFYIDALLQIGDIIAEYKTVKEQQEFCEAAYQDAHRQLKDEVETIKSLGTEVRVIEVMKQFCETVGKSEDSKSFKTLYEYGQEQTAIQKVDKSPSAR